MKWATLWQNNKMTVHPAKTQISLGICPVWSEPSLCTQWVAKDPRFLHADSEDSDHPLSLIWVFAGCKCHFVGFVMRWLKCLLISATIETQFISLKPTDERHMIHDLRKPVYAIIEQQRRSLVSTFVVRCLDRLIPLPAIAEISRS